MRTLLVTLLLLSAPVALAHGSTYVPDWNARHSDWNQGSLAGPARQLDQAATRLYQDIRSYAGRSEMTSRARELAEAADTLRRLAERRSSPAQLQAAYRQVQYRYANLERRMDNRRYEWRHRQALAALQTVERALNRTGYALERSLRDRRDDRYVRNDRDRDNDHWRDRDDDHRRDRDDRWRDRD